MYWGKTTQWEVEEFNLNNMLSKRIGEMRGTGNLELPDYIDPDKFGNDIRDSLDGLVHKHSIQSFKEHLVNYFLSLGALEHNRLRRKIVESAVKQVKLVKDMSSRIKIDGKEHVLCFKGDTATCVDDETFTWTMEYNTEEMGDD